MASTRVEKVTIRLSEDSLAFADRLAEEWSTTRSGVVARLLDQEHEARLRPLMEEGYQVMTSENRRHAEEALGLVREVSFETDLR